MDAPTLTVEEVFGRRRAVDEDGNRWIEFRVDHLALQDSGICAVCGDELEEGWLCLDGGEEVCYDHPEVVNGKVPDG